MTGDELDGLLPYDVDWIDVGDLGDFDVANDPGWSDIWDVIEGIIGGPADLARKVGEAALALWDAIWTGIGGALRWIWEWMVGTYNMFAYWLEVSLNALARGIGDGVRWVKDRIWEHIDDVRGWVDGAAAWVKNEIWGRVGDVAGWLWDAAGWLDRQLTDARNWLRVRVEDAAEWVRNEVWAAAEALWFWLWDAANWIKNETLRPIMGAMGDIGDAFREGFEKVGGTIEAGATALGDKIGDGLEFVFMRAFEPLVDTIEFKLAIPGRLIRGEYRDLMDLVDDIVDPAPAVLATIAGPIILAVVMALVVSGLMMFLVQPLAEPHIQDIRAGVGAQLLTRMDLQMARWRGLGVDVDGQLSRQGYGVENREAIAELDKRIPAPPDLVRMAVREAFDRSLAEQLGYVTPLPPGFADGLARQGYEAEWAERWWWAHWRLPSMGEAFEMFHRLRGDFTEDDLRLLLKAQDIPYLWHDRFIQIAYKPLTRVDVRRMFVMEVLSPEEVKDAYLDLGYDEVNAQRMTDFTIRYAAPDEDGELKEFRDLAQSMFRKAYRQHVLTRAEALDFLIDAGYQEDVADFLLTLDDVALGLRPDLDADLDVRGLTTGIIRAAVRDGLWSRDKGLTELEDLGYMAGSAELMLSLDELAQEREITDLEIGVIREEYKADGISREEAVARLDDLGVGAKRRELLVKRWELDKAETPRRLTVGQLQVGWRGGQLDDGEFTGKVQALGYTAPDAEYLLSITAKRLTLSQLQRLLKAGEISEGGFVGSVRKLGYSEEDARSLASRTIGQLTLGQLREGLRRGVLEEGKFRERVLALGYAEGDVELLVAMVSPPPVAAPSVGQLQEGLRRELISEAEFLAAMLARGYTEEDAGFLAGVATRRLSVTQLQKGYAMGKLTEEELVAALVGTGYSGDDAQYILSITERKEEEPEEEV